MDFAEILKTLNLSEVQSYRLEGYEQELEEDVTKFLVEKMVEEMGDEEVDKIYEQTADSENNSQFIDLIWAEKLPQMEACRERWLEEYRLNFDVDYFLKYYSDTK